jgi:hypothetical protein
MAEQTTLVRKTSSGAWTTMAFEKDGWRNPKGEKNAVAVRRMQREGWRELNPGETVELGSARSQATGKTIKLTRKENRENTREQRQDKGEKPKDTPSTT